MNVLDVNVLVSALHAGAADHDAMRTYLEAVVNGSEPVAVSDAVLVGAVRVLTHPRVFDPPATPAQAVASVSALIDHPRVRVLPTTPRQWSLTAELVTAAQAKGNLVADAGHAAHAISHGATLVSKDRDFARFPGLSWRVPETSTR